MATPIITLTTDFGTRDGYVAAVKGYLLSRLAWLDVRIVDITHDIPRGDVAHAAWIVGSALRQFPEESIHYVVVGWSRAGAAVVEDGRIFVGPNTGAFANLEPLRANEVNVPNPIFNGRELYAPAVVDLARRGAQAVATLGPPIRRLVQLPWGRRSRGEGRVVHVDHFGNAISDLPVEECDAPGVRIAGQYAPLVDSYADGAPGQLIAYVGNEGTIELAVRDGRANLQRGAAVLPAEAGGAYR